MEWFSNPNDKTDSDSFTNSDYEVYKPSAAEKARTKKIAAEAKKAAENAVKAKALAKAKKDAVLAAKIKAEKAKKAADKAAAEAVTNAALLSAKKLKGEKEAAEAKLKAAELAEKVAQQQAAAAAAADALAAKKAKEEAEKLALIKKEDDAAKKAKELIEKKHKAASDAIITKAQRERDARIQRLKAGGIQVTNGYGYIEDSSGRRRWVYSEKLLLIQSEAIRRTTEDERRVAIDAVIAAEPQTKLDFDNYAEMLQLEFDLLMQNNYPWFVRGNNWTVAERAQKEKEVESEIRNLKLILEKRRAQNLKNKKVELARKSKESKLIQSKLIDDEQQFFFEEVVNDDEIEIQEENEASSNMTDVEKAKKAIDDIEDKLGRAVVPHRDMIESTDSDFDIESQLNPDDILIRDDREADISLTHEHQLELLQLQKSMEDAGEDEVLYITGKIAASNMKAAIDSVTDTFNTPPLPTDDDTVTNGNEVPQSALEESMKFIQADIRGAQNKYDYFARNQIGEVRQIELIFLNSVLENPSIAIPDSTQLEALRSELRQLKTLMGI